MHSRFDFNQLVRDYQVYVELVDKSRFSIRGRIDAVREVKKLVDSKIDKNKSSKTTESIKPENVGIAQAAAIETKFVNEDDDSIICIDENKPDLYEMSDGENDYEPWPRKSKEENVDDSIIIIEGNRLIYSHNALAQGYTSHQVNQVCNELKDKIEKISEAEFMQYLENKIKTVRFF